MSTEVDPTKPLCCEKAAGNVALYGPQHLQPVIFFWQDGDPTEVRYCPFCGGDPRGDIIQQLERMTAEQQEERKQKLLAWLHNLPKPEPVKEQPCSSQEREVACTCVPAGCTDMLCRGICGCLACLQEE